MSDRVPVEAALVIPVYNERDNLPLLIDEIARAVGGEGRSYEIVAVDDGSTDGSLEVLEGLRRDHPELRIVAFAERAGQTAALERSRAAAVVGYRVNRHDSAWKRLQSRIANGVRNRLNHETIRDTGCSLKAFRADAVRALPLFDGMHRFLPTLIRMEGGTVVELPVRHRPRRFGRTKYGMWNRVFRSFADALAVRWMQRRALRYRVREEIP